MNSHLNMVLKRYRDVEHRVAVNQTHRKSAGTESRRRHAADRALALEARVHNVQTGKLAEGLLSNTISYAMGDAMH